MTAPLRPTLFLALALLASPHGSSALEVGAALVDITPKKLPVLVNGGMLSRYFDQIKTAVHARAVVLRQDQTQVALVVVDSCMMGRDLLDEAKRMAAEKTGIPADHQLISATHTHTAPSAMACLGTEADPEYVPFLREKLVEVIAAAQRKLQPAKMGFAKGNAARFTALRQWIRRPDRLAEDPFGNLTVRANMHAGRNWDDVTGESGPEDPDLSLISFQSAEGKPLAVLGNFSMHYFGDKDISADYFGLFCEGLKNRIAPEGEFVGLLSHGCSGDIYRTDYTVPEKERWDPSIEEYTNGLLEVAMTAYRSIQHTDTTTLQMAETRLPMTYRTPDKQMLEWAHRIVNEMGERSPKNQTEVYAREQLILQQLQKTEVVVQALRIGQVGIATTPCETYAITGLKIKAASPLAQTMVIELANGGDGYIPPPAMHAFGGYNTWAARSAGLEVMAEPRITQAAISLLEKVTGQKRRPWTLGEGPAAQTIRALQPLAWWRLNECEGPHALDATSSRLDATYEQATAYYLEGPHSAQFCAPGEVNRAPHFVGSRLRAHLPQLTGDFSISLWFWNGMPEGAREISGWLLSRDHDHGLSAHGEHIGVGGKSRQTARLVYQTGPDQKDWRIGKKVIPRWQWQHLVYVRTGDKVQIHLNGALDLETEAKATAIPQWFLAGRSDNDSNWEGRIDEVAIFPRALKEQEVHQLMVRESTQVE
jgi:hypothetical protein